ncbi:hypothetical protein [Yeosuana marina]|uniref:hypothetical protein n=1 Tax=Yeosuana marina TaxID=1565536 RepID=UPI0030C8C208
MTKPLKSVSIVALFLFLVCCSSKDNCTKTIIVQYESTIYGQLGTTYIPEITQEVPCDLPEPETVQPIGEGNVLNNFSYDVINFVFTPDTGNNTSRLQFEIKLNNENNFIVRGDPILTINSDNIQFSKSYSADATSVCNEIQANSSCILIYDKETPIDVNLGIPNKFELVSVKYIL